MNIRAMKPEDLEVLREIHEKYYRDEFPFPDFEQHFLCSFVCHGSDGRIISAGGLRTITESILITDECCSVKERREALLQILNTSIFVANKFKYSQIHAFVEEGKWKIHLEKIGFQETKGQSLVLKF